MSLGTSLDVGTKRIFTVVAWISLLTIVAVSLYGLFEWVTGHVGIVGQQLVDVYWPWPPYFAQPVTYFSVACVALFYSGLRLWEEMIVKWPKSVLSTLQLAGFIVAFSSAYEVLYNFMLWGAVLSTECVASPSCNPDVYFTTYPAPWNLVFATRVFAALFVISGYSVYYLRRLTKSQIL